MDKIKIMGFHQPPTIIFDDPPFPNDTPKFHLIYIKRWVIDVKAITYKRLAQFIGQKTLLQKNLRGLQQPPSEDEGEE